MRFCVVLVAWLAITLTSLSACASDELVDYRPPARPSVRFRASIVVVNVRELERSGVPAVFYAEQHPPDPSRVTAPPDVHTVSREELAEILDCRTTRVAGDGAGPLELDVAVLAVEGRSDDDETTKATLEVRARRPGGPDLVVSRGSSRARGHLGAMTSGIPERITATLIDAFDGIVLRDEFIRATNQALVESAEPATSATERTAPPPRRIDSVERRWLFDRHVLSGTAHLGSIAFDAGDAYAVGVRYLHDHLSVEHGLFWAGYGAEARWFWRDGRGVRAAGGLLVGRVGVAVEQAISLEAGVGATGGDRTGGVALLGAYLGFYYLELGGTVQIPFAPVQKPEWLAPVAFGVRLNLPLHVTTHPVERRSPLPAGDPSPLPGLSRRAPECDAVPE